MKRAIRTTLQVGLITTILELFLAFGIDFTERQQKAIIAVGTILISFIQNLLEDKEIIPSILKSEPMN